MFKQKPCLSFIN